VVRDDGDWTGGRPIWEASKKEGALNTSTFYSTGLVSREVKRSNSGFGN